MARYQRFSDERLAEHLAAGKTVAAAAQAAGISERSAYRRKKQPAVRDRIAEVRRAALDTASARLDQGMVVACDRLIGLLGHANPHVQIRAAQTVIQMALKVRHEVDVADQLDRLAEPTRPSSVLPDAVAPSAVLDPAPDRTDPSEPQGLPEPTTPNCAAGSPTETEPAPVGIELATGGDDRDPGARPDPPPTPKPPGDPSGFDRRARPNRTAQLMAMVSVLLLLAGLPCAVAGETSARVERGPAADGGLPTCQNLTEPATSRHNLDNRHPSGRPGADKPCQFPPVSATAPRPRGHRPDSWLPDCQIVPDRATVGNRPGRARPAGSLTPGPAP